MNATRGSAPEVDVTGNPEPQADTERARPEHVLVMNHQGDRAPAVAAQVPRFLQEAGYHVTVASGPAESARQRAAAHARRRRPPLTR